MALNPLGASLQRGARRREQESAKILQDSLTLGCNAAAGALKNIIGMVHLYVVIPPVVCASAWFL